MCSASSTSGNYEQKRKDSSIRGRQQLETDLKIKPEYQHILREQNIVNHTSRFNLARPPSLLRFKNAPPP